MPGNLLNHRLSRGDTVLGPVSEVEVRCVLIRFSILNRLFGLVVRRPPRGRKIPGLNPACARIISGSSHTSDLKIGTPVATLPDAWRYRVSAGTGRPGVSILWLGEVDCLICNFCLSVAAREIVWADPTLRCTSLLLGRWATNKQTLYSKGKNIDPLSQLLCSLHPGAEPTTLLVRTAVLYVVLVVAEGSGREEKCVITGNCVVFAHQCHLRFAQNCHVVRFMLSSLH